MKATQKSLILNLLENSEWVCTSDMYRLYIADPRRRICDLKDDGYVLESRPCQNPNHGYHDGGSKEWRLIGRKVQEGGYSFEPVNQAGKIVHQGVFV